MELLKSAGPFINLIRISGNCYMSVDICEIRLKQHKLHFSLVLFESKGLLLHMTVFPVNYQIKQQE